VVGGKVTVGVIGGKVTVGVVEGKVTVGVVVMGVVGVGVGVALPLTDWWQAKHISMVRPA